MATRTIKAAGGTTNTKATFVEEVLPTAADDVVVEEGATGEINFGGPLNCRSADFSNHHGVLNMDATLKVGGSTVNGDLALKFGANQTISGTANIELLSTSATQAKIYTNGKALASNVAFKGTGGSWILMDDFTTTGFFKPEVGTFVGNGKTISAARFLMSSAAVRTVNIEGCTLILSGSVSGTFEGGSEGTLHFHAANSTIRLTGAGAANQFREDDEFEYFRLELLGTGTVDFGPGTRFVTHLVRSNAAACSLTYPAERRLTITDGGSVDVSGSPGALVTVSSDTSGKPFELSMKRGNVVSNDYVSLQDIDCRGGASFYWGDHSTRGTKATGCIFTEKVNSLEPLARGLRLGIISTPDDVLETYQAANSKIPPGHFDFVMVFNGWQDDILFPGQAKMARQLGAHIHTAWQPKVGAQGTDFDGTLGDTTRGVLDAYFKESAGKVAAEGRTMYVRLAHEFNGNWPSYGTFKETPERFIAGWQHVVPKMRAYLAELGAPEDLIRFIWCPNVWNETQFNHSSNDPTAYYPGDDYVDFVALDGYQNKVRGFILPPDQIFLDNALTITGISSREFWIGEVGCAADARFGGSKKGWYDELFKMFRQQMPFGTAANIWARTDEPEEGDYSLDSSGTDPEALAVVAAAANQVRIATGDGPTLATRHIKSRGVVVP